MTSISVRVRSNRPLDRSVSPITRAALAIAPRLIAELFAEDPLVERVARIMQQDERRRLVHRDLDFDHAADFEVVGGGGDRALVGFHHLDGDALRISEQRTAPTAGAERRERSE